MCGITGFFSYKHKIETKKYYNAHKKIAHRGPDDEGFIYKNEQNQIEHLIGDDTIKELEYRKKIYEKESSSLILGHRRLSIIDLTSAGHQPYVYENLYLVYNGEIYNYIELREELQKLGYSFQTDSDTEVFLKAYHCWGIEAFNRFNGMWASAIYDKNKDEILLTRDRFGIKPLYYTLVNDNLIFGSEIKFISSFYDKLESNEQMVYEYVEYGYISHTNETFFKDIYQLEKGYYALYKNDEFKKSKYYISKEDKKDIAINDIKSTLLDSIKLRMRSDVKVGSLLSGGMDSSAIVCSVFKEQMAKELETFTITYKEKELDYEAKYVEDINKMTGFKNNKIFLEPDSEIVDKLTYIIESPYRSFSEKAMFKIYEHIKSNTDITVLLNGEGSDEIFSGYNAHYYYHLLSILFSFRFKEFKNELNCIQDRTGKSKKAIYKEMIVSFLVYSNFQKYFKQNKFFTKKFTTNRLKTTSNFIKDELDFNKNISALPEYLTYADKIPMYFSLEVRVPFLDYRLVEKASKLTNKQLIHKGVTKWSLREAIKDIVPKSVYERKDKKGFYTPFDSWIKTDFKDKIEYELLNIKENGLFDFINSDEIYKYYIKNGVDTKIWRIYCLSRWKKVWNVCA